MVHKVSSSPMALSEVKHRMRNFPDDMPDS